jgi:hypothetical protein
VAALALACSAGVARAETAEEIEGGILEAWGKVESITALLELETTVIDLPMLGAGDAAVFKLDGTERYRQTIQLDFPPPMGVRGGIRCIYDGADLYVVNELMGRVEAFKTRPAVNEAAPPPSPVLLLESVKAAYDIEPAEGGDVDGRAVWWLEGARRERVDRVERIRLAFDRETGFPLRVEMHTPGAPAPLVISYSGLDVNAELDPADFVFTAPADVELDEGTAQTPDGTPEAAEPEASEPAESGPAPLEEQPDGADQGADRETESEQEPPAAGEDAGSGV